MKYSIDCETKLQYLLSTMFIVTNTSDFNHHQPIHGVCVWFTKIWGGTSSKNLFRQPTWHGSNNVSLLTNCRICSISNSYSTVARDLSLKTIPSPRAQPEGERLFSMINPWLPCYNYYISYLIGWIHSRRMVLASQPNLAT